MAAPLGRVHAQNSAFERGISETLVSRLSITGIILGEWSCLYCQPVCSLGNGTENFSEIPLFNSNEHPQPTKVGYCSA